MAPLPSQAYVVPCAAAFRDAVLALAARRHAQPGDLVRAVLLMIEPAEIERFPDPGEPPPAERETVTIASGAGAGRVLKRKPRLQLRLPPGLSAPTIRRALGLALKLAETAIRVDLRDGAAPPPEARLAALREEAAALRGMLGAVAFQPLPGGVRTIDEARYVLRFAPGEYIDLDIVKARFNTLARVFHPDRALSGDGARMGQLIDARRHLERVLRGR